MSSYLRDLAARQNKEITSAEIHQLESTKKYSNDDIKKAVDNIKKSSNEIKKKSNQMQLDISDIAISNLCRILNKNKVHINTKIDNVNKNELKEIKTNDNKDVFIYDKKIIFLNKDGQHIKLNVKEDFIDDLINTFKKLDGWCNDNDYDCLKAKNKNDNDVIISRIELKTAINIFLKLNSIIND